MSGRRTNPVYIVMMSVAFLCAFVLPERITDSARLHLSGIFNPLSYPIRRIATWASGPGHGNLYDSRPDQSILSENDQLRQEVARLSANVDRLQRLDDQRQELGDLKALCVHAAVAGDDAGGRDGLILTSSDGKLAEDVPVIYAGGLAGRLQAAGGAARVRLLTDEGFAVTGAFLRIVNSDGVVTAQRIATATPLVQGQGHGKLAVVGMRLSDYRAAGLRPGDWVVLDDPQWPAAIQGIRLGRIVSASQLRGAPLFADIALATQDDLTRLGDVWVMAKERTP